MHAFIMFLCGLLSGCLNYIIVLLFLFEVGLSVWLFLRLSGDMASLEKLTEVTDEREPGRRGPGRSVITSKRVITERNWDAYVSFRKSYTRTMTGYDVYFALIQLFTLLGILGTVAGLYLSLNAVPDTGGIQNISYDGIAFALSSTILGIGCTVILKLLDIALSGRYIDRIDDRLDLFEKDYGVKNDALTAEAASREDKP